MLKVLCVNGHERTKDSIYSNGDCKLCAKARASTWKKENPFSCGHLRTSENTRYTSTGKPFGCVLCPPKKRTRAVKPVIGKDKACNRWHKKTDEQKKQLSQKRRLAKFSLSTEDYDALVEAFGGVCGICQGGPNPTRDFAIDHNHSCCPSTTSCGQCIRGILCLECNLWMSWLDRVGLDSVAAYIQGWLA